MPTIRVSGGNLYQLASQYLGDATQWIRIAVRNGLSDPMLPPTVQTIIIPEVNLAATGGTPTQ